MCRRSSRIRVRDTASTLSPRKVTSPAVGSISRRAQRASVVFPLPDSPTNPTTSPSPIVRLTSSTAVTIDGAAKRPRRRTNCFDTWLMSRSGVTNRAVRGGTDSREVHGLAAPSSTPPDAPIGSDRNGTVSRLERRSQAAGDRALASSPRWAAAAHRAGSSRPGSEAVVLACRDAPVPRGGACLAVFHDFAGYDSHAIGCLGHHTEVVSDEQEREAEALAEVAQELQDLRLDGRVERGGRLVGDEQRRPARPARSRSSRAGRARLRADAGTPARCSASVTHRLEKVRSPTGVPRASLPRRGPRSPRRSGPQS